MNKEKLNSFVNATDLLCLFRGIPRIGHPQDREFETKGSSKGDERGNASSGLGPPSTSASESLSEPRSTMTTAAESWGRQINSLSTPMPSPLFANATSSTSIPT
jgi:hypothetical protein